MKKLLTLFLGIFVFASCAFANEEEVVSTEGVELDASITKTIKQQSKQEKKEFSKEKKAKNKYISNVKNIKNLKENKRLKERDLDFYYERLQIQQNRLNELQEEAEKGENQ